MPFDRRDLDGSIPGRFEAQVDAGPERPAVGCGEETWTYERLERAANRIAHALPDPCGPVMVLLGQTPALVAAILGVLKRGGMYVPLDPGVSRALAAAVAAESGARVVLADVEGSALAREALVSLSIISVPDLLAGGGREDRPRAAIPPDTPAYIYYTSGTTGRPKGVVDSHRNVLHNVMRYTNSLGLDREDRLSLVQTAGFSGAVSSLFGALLNGAAVFPADPRSLDGGVAAWAARRRLTIWHSVPSLFRLLAEGSELLPDLRIIRLEGDRMTRADLRLFHGRFADHCVLVNGLGATECGLVRQYFIHRDMPIADGVVPVGYPVEDMDVEVVDASGECVRPGETGEIVVRSRYLALGYHRRPDLTVRAFAPTPGNPDLRTYRTSDLGRLRSDGCLEHLGRLDARAKLHGVWVDTAEVEAVLLAAEGVREAVARVLADDDEPRLVAWIVPVRPPAPTSATLRAYLAGRLPAAAVPSAFVVLDRLPLTRGGKVDHTALPAPTRERPDLGTDPVAPRTALEREIAEIWRDVLGLDEVGVRDSFFALGGESLAMSRVQARLAARLGVQLRIVELFDLPTIEALVQRLEKATTSGTATDGVRSRGERIAQATAGLAARRRR